MRKLKAWFALKLLRFAIRIYEDQPWYLLTPEDKRNLAKLWEYHDEFERRLA